MNFPSCPRPPNSPQLESSGLCFCTDLHRRQGHWTLRLCLASIDHAANTELAARDRSQVHLDRTVTCSALPIQLFSPWLREVGVVERRPVRTSRDVMSRRRNRPRHREALYFPHRRLWITEYSCKVWDKPCIRRPGRPRAPARVFALARKDAEQAEHVTEGVVGDVAPLEETVETDSERGD
ncbi:hypothetical protein Taro_004361 [Colocasia esculenta]|uniref:Uncharacterized protein n=1 Tax=Colocasia esculenta TaxID=4460 RepID=A0A843TRG6_COLES|nr:hypothetical protein [Colocasia esculenta]